MASAHATITVVDGALLVEGGLRRPVRLTPDGYAGVVYGGVVYPLRSGDVVDLAGPSWERADCDRFILMGAQIPYAHDHVGSRGEPLADFDGDWYLGTNQFGHYVVFNAPERVAISVVEQLERSGLSVQRWDVSHRPADNGRLYDWFARLRFKGSREEALAQVQAALAVDATTPATPRIVDPVGQQLEDLEARLESLLNALYIATRRADAAEHQIQQLQSRVRDARNSDQRKQAALERANAHNAALQEQLRNLRERVDTGADIEELVRQLADAEELREFALSENADLLAQIRVKEEEAERESERSDNLSSEIEGLRDHLAEVEAQERERRRSSAKPQLRRGGVAEFIPIAFSRLEFVLDSVEILANFEAPAAAMRALSQIDSGRLVGRDLEGARGWLEVSKVATGIAGSEDLGRIYYKPDGQRVLISVHVKQDDKQQRRHIERLRAV